MFAPELVDWADDFVAGIFPPSPHSGSQTGHCGDHPIKRGRIFPARTCASLTNDESPVPGMGPVAVTDSRTALPVRENNGEPQGDINVVEHAMLSLRNSSQHRDHVHVENVIPAALPVGTDIPDGTNPITALLCNDSSPDGDNIHADASEENLMTDASNEDHVICWYDLLPPSSFDWGDAQPPKATEFPNALGMFFAGDSEENRALNLPSKPSPECWYASNFEKRAVEGRLCRHYHPSM